MAKELPYFKFVCNEWDSGNIQMCSMEAQGLFMNLCSLYWSRLGKLPVKLAKQKLCNSYANAYQELLEEGIIKEENDKIMIVFLDEQLCEFEDTSEKRRNAANERWKKANAMQVHSKSNAIREDESIEDKIKEKDIDYIYSLYPSKCPYKKSSTGKGSKSKEKIKSLLKTHSKDHLENAIKFYLDECKKGGTWLRNFKTFLNDLPDVEEATTQKGLLDQFCKEMNADRSKVLRKFNNSEEKLYRQIEFDLQNRYKNTTQTFESLLKQKITALNE